MRVQSEPQADLAETLWRETEQLWEGPFVFAVNWWMAAAQSLIPHHQAHPHQQDDDDQLAVPEPFEAEGEPGLFA